MALTRGQLITRISTKLERPGDTAFETIISGDLDQMLFFLFDMHDWNWKHKSDSFNTVSGTESYNLANNQRVTHGAVAGGPFTTSDIITGTDSSATGQVVTVGSGYLEYSSISGTITTGELITGSSSGATSTTSSGPILGVTGSRDLRSSQDIEVLWDSTNKRFLSKTDLHLIRKRYPEGSQSGKPKIYAPWGSKTIYLDNIPDAEYAMKFLYLAKATLPTADGDDLETVCGVPDYCHYLLEKLLLAEAMIIDNDDRRDNLLIEIERMWKPKAINADMKHLESTSRFKLWKEELQPSGVSYDDSLRHTWWGED